MAGEREQCRDVLLPSGESIRVRGSGGLGPAGAAAMGELVEAARRRHEREHPPERDAVVLWARLDMARRERGLSLREISQECGVPFKTLFRCCQGIAPGETDTAAILAWLDRSEADRG